jgi:hypothetical protein
MGHSTERRSRWRRPRFVDDEIDEDHIYEAMRAQRERLRKILAVLESRALEVLHGGPCTSAALAVAVAD